MSGNQQCSRPSWEADHTRSARFGRMLGGVAAAKGADPEYDHPTDQLAYSFCIVVVLAGRWLQHM